MWVAATWVIACSTPVRAEPAPVDGAAIYTQHCAGCHDGGMRSFLYRAPRIGTPYWSARLTAVGKDILVTHTRNGVGRMPAQGGAGGLADAQVEAAVDHLLAAPANAD